MKSAAFVAVFCAGSSPPSYEILPKPEEVALVLMQMRYDGTIGFMGGLLEEEEDPKEGAIRELYEESGYQGNEADLVLMKEHDTPNLKIFFFALQITSRAKFEEIEKGVLAVSDYGYEVFGVIRVPLFITDKGNGFLKFVYNRFAASALDDLLLLVKTFNLMRKEQIEKVEDGLRTLQHTTS